MLLFFFKLEERLFEPKTLSVLPGERLLTLNTFLSRIFHTPDAIGEAYKVIKEMLFITSHTNSIIVLLAVFILPLTLIESVEEVVSVAGQTPTLLHFYTVWLRNLAFSITHQQ